MEYPAIKPVQKPATETPVVEQSYEPAVIVHEHKEVPPSLSKEPLINKLLDINDDHFNIPDDTKYLDEFILSEIKRQELTDSEESYKSVLDFLVKKTNVPDGLDIYAKLERLTEYAKIQQKLYEAAREKEEFLKKDPEDMTSSELKKYIEER